MLYGSLRAALYVCSVCGGCHALLAPLVPLGAVGGASHYPANCMVGGKSACYHLPNARAMLYGGTRTALHMRGGRGGRYVLLAPLAPLAHLRWALPRLLVFGRRRPFKLLRYCFWSCFMALGGGAEQKFTIQDLVSVYLSSCPKPVSTLKI